MIPTLGQPTRQYGIGAVDYYTGETVVLVRPRKRRREIAPRHSTQPQSMGVRGVFAGRPWDDPPRISMPQPLAIGNPNVS